MDYTITYIMLGLGTLMTGLWLLLFMKAGSKYNQITGAIDKKKFILSDIFFIGFSAIDLFRINLKTEKRRQKIKKIAEVHGERYAEFYHYVVLGGQIAYALTVAPFALYIGAIANDYMVGGLLAACAVGLVMYLDMEINNAVNRKRDEILSDYPEVLSKLTLLVNAGLVVRDAWVKVAYTAEGALYKEMQFTSEEIRNGTSETDAYYNFAHRCAIKEIRKFASVLTQNLQKGSAELTTSLKYMTAESWEEKKHYVKRKGELANQKLLFPLMIMFVGILMMIMVPIVTNMF
ncbi:MAG: type II secretion system F family protein [Peptococcaceae bacterium]|nr:type II secretion system F family protein [Peptococcaceae bacterium]